MMTNLTIFFIYLLIINLVSGLVFAYDKFAAMKERRRIPESTLHFLEFMGGAMINLVLMFVLRHKNKKSYYYKWTWLLLVLWLFVISMLF